MSESVSVVDKIIAGLVEWPADSRRLDPAGVSAAAKALYGGEGGSDREIVADVVSAYLAVAGSPADERASTPNEEFTEAAWGLIANAYGGNWSDAPDEWHGAACRWRDEYTAGATARIPAASPADERLREAQDSDSTWPWPIAPDTVMPPRRQPVRWGSRADDPPTEIHDDPQRTKAYLAGLATGRAESRDRTEALRQIVDLPVVDDSDADRMREIADAALAGVSAEATPDDGGRS